MRVHSLPSLGLVLALGAWTAGCSQPGISPNAPSTTPGIGGTQWETGVNGCTPGYWKQEQHFDSWPSSLPGEEYAELTPDMSFSDAFGLGPNQWWADDFTMLDALSTGGGGLEALARHAAAALLNATLEFYPLSWEQVRELFYDALQGEKGIEQVKNIFERHNERRCLLT